ncbi:MAG: gluconolactonase, partial [Clostridia bacterium]|nr:gluconolactonase [Clostridia bacterium]
MQKKLKKILAFIFSLILLCAFGMQISAYSPYENYTFDASGKRVSEPQAVIPVKTVDGSDIGVGHFSGLSDIYIRFDTLYLVDSGNNRIVITDKNFNL